MSRSSTGSHTRPTPDRVCAVVLSAGEGRRLRPLTSRRPKALCPVGNVPLLDRALAAVAELGFQGAERVAVNAWHRAEDIVAHVGDRAFVSVEAGQKPLGSAGGLGALRDWIDGRDVLVANADAYLRGGVIEPLLDGWDRAGTRMLGVRAGAPEPAANRAVEAADPMAGRPAEFGAYRFAGFSLLPWRRVAALPAEPADLVRAVWRPAEAAGELSVIAYHGIYIDSGTVSDYLAANLDAARAAGGSLVDATAIVSGPVATAVIGAGARVTGAVERSVVWPGAVVRRGERLVNAVRYGRNGTARPG